MRSQGGRLGAWRGLDRALQGPAESSRCLDDEGGKRAFYPSLRLSCPRGWERQVESPRVDTGDPIARDERGSVDLDRKPRGL